MSKEKLFLELFNRLEKHLRIEYTNEQYSYSGFMSTIYKIKKSNKNSTISNKYNFDIIKQASQIRNIIAHNNDILVPSDRFLSQFEEIVESICNPLKVENIMISFQKLKTVNLDNTIGDAVELLKTHGYNTIPVIQNGELMGVFTEKSLFDYFSMHKSSDLNKNMKISDIIESIDLNSDPRKYFEFVGRHLSVEAAYEHFSKDLKSRRELLLLLVTENGNRNEKLLGIVALRDIENALFS